MRNEKVNRQCNNFGPKKCQRHPKPPKYAGNTQISRFGNFGPFGLKFTQNVRNEKVNRQCSNLNCKGGVLVLVMGLFCDKDAAVMFEAEVEHGATEHVTIY